MLMNAKCNLAKTIFYVSFFSAFSNNSVQLRRYPLFGLEVIVGTLVTIWPTSLQIRAEALSTCHALLFQFSRRILCAAFFASEALLISRFFLEAVKESITETKPQLNLFTTMRMFFWENHGLCLPTPERYQHGPMG